MKIQLILIYLKFIFNKKNFSEKIFFQQNLKNYLNIMVLVC